MCAARAEADYISHPDSVPLRLCIPPGRDGDGIDLVVHGQGGVRIRATLGYLPGTCLEVRVSACERELRFRGLVLWRRPLAAHHFELGLGFATDAAAFRARMVEQLCYIEAYRRRQAARGVTLSPEQAARDWVRRFSGSFPRLGGVSPPAASVRRHQPQPGVAIA